jgi:threonine synthase
MISHLACSRCGAQASHREVNHLCSCGAPLLARYDVEAARQTLTRDALRERPPTIWRFRELLPLDLDEESLTLGEGGTPLLHARHLGARLGLRRLLVKDESQNPTGSFKARGMAVAVSKARSLGARAVCLPSAGNAGGAAAAYAALAGLEAHVYLPVDTPPAFEAEARAVGAVVQRAGASIAEAAREMARAALSERWYDLSTFKEPYRVEGKKTMGFEIVETLGRLPDAVIYPAGGGTGLVGLWKAFDEMEALGWVGSQRPRMFAVQAEGCAPLVRAFEEGGDTAPPWSAPATRALGLRVPQSRADFLILNVLRASGGAALAVPEEAIAEGERLLGSEGLHASPESGVAAAGLARLVWEGRLDSDETVVLMHTAGGAKYAAAGEEKAPEARARPTAPARVGLTGDGSEVPVAGAAATGA